MGRIIKTHLCIIGAGSGGLVVASGAAQLGLDVILIERDKMGGECLNYGCVPSKALLHASQEKDFEKAMAHVKNAIHTIEPHDSVERFEELGVKVLFGEARFKDAHHISVGKDVIHAKYSVIATGSEASVPQIPGLDKVDFFTHKTVFDMKVQPKHIGIIGGGPIGIEMAQAFSNMGTKVSVIQHGRILARDDKEAVDVVRAQLIKQGVEFYEHSDVLEVKQKGKQIHLNMPKGEVKCNALLLAAGKRPSICALDLQKIGVKFFDAIGIQVNSKMQTNISHIYAIGDAAAGPNFTHVAGYQAGIVLKNILFKLPSHANLQALPWVTYAKPELAQIGLTAIQAKVQYKKIKVIKEYFSEIDRAVAEDKMTGFVKIMVKPNGIVVGATIVGPHAGELIQIWGFAIQNKIKLSKIANMIVPYPTLAEINKRVAGLFYKPFIFGHFMKSIVKFLSRF